MIKVTSSLNNMRKFSTIIIVLFLGFNFFSYSQIYELEKNKHVRVEIIVPGNHYHHDGANYIKNYPYTIKDTLGNIIISLPSSINKNHLIEIFPGIYNLELCKVEEKKVFRLTVSDENFQQFRIKE